MDSYETLRAKVEAITDDQDVIYKVMQIIIDLKHDAYIAGINKMNEVRKNVNNNSNTF